MKAFSYYNEFDPNAAAWLRQLIAEGLIPPGEVDTRSITDVQPSDLVRFTQCHFFAGIGGWSLALILAGIPPTEPLWTGSAPCQPFSIANVAHGGGQGQDDERHLAPVFAGLIRKCRPSKVLGEQVAASIGKGWWDDLASSLEAEGYACCSAVLPACSVGADHERKRLFWGAYASGAGWEGRQQIERLSLTAQAAFALSGNPFAGARRVLEGDQRGLLSCDGLSVVMERCALKGYGNAIVPQAAALFIQAFQSCRA